MAWYPIFGDKGIRVSGYTFSADHPAIDINPAVGPPLEGNIYAPESGTVTWWGQSPDEPGKDRGLHLILRQDDGHTLDICHMAGVPWPWDGDPGAWRGVWVERGDFLGFVGHTGTVSPPGPAGAHVHLIVTRDGVRIDPYPLLFPEEAPVEPTPPHEFTPQEMEALVDAWDTAEWLEAAPDGAMQTYAKAVKNVVRMAKGEPLEQPQAAEEALNG